MYNFFTSNTFKSRQSHTSFPLKMNKEEKRLENNEKTRNASDRKKKRERTQITERVNERQNEG